MKVPSILAVALVLAFGCQASSGSRAPDSPEALLARADRSFDLRQYGQALESYRLAAFAARGRGDDAHFAEAAGQVASVLALQGLPTDARPWLAEAEARASAEAPAGWTRVLLARGLVAWKEARPADALATFRELFQFCFLHGETARAIQACQLATLVSAGSEQLEWARRGIETAAATGKPAWEAPLWSNLGWLLAARGLAAESVEAFARAAELTRQSETDRFGRARAEWALAHAQLEAGQLAPAQTALDELQAVLAGLYARERTPAVAEYNGRVLLDLARLDVLGGRDAVAEERLVRARARLVEAGALEAAPTLIDEVDARLAEVRERLGPRSGR